MIRFYILEAGVPRDEDLKRLVVKWDSHKDENGIVSVELSRICLALSCVPSRVSLLIEKPPQDSRLPDSSG